MVDKEVILASNAAFSIQRRQKHVCVFAGATSGIGYGTLRRMVTMLESSKFYILGRSLSRFTAKLNELRASAPTCDIIFVEADLSLIADIDAACKQIKEAEQRVDYLCMSPGGMPFQGAVYTKENLELSFAVSYYSRLRIVSNLLPLLRSSPHPRVLSILKGTREKRINEDDIGLEKQWTITGLVNHSTICTDMAFDYLAADDLNKNVIFLHATPGFVNTGTPRTTYPSKKDGILWWAFLSVMQIVSGWMIRSFGYDLSESGERHAFLLTSDGFSAGSWQTNKFNDVVPPNGALQYYQKHGWAPRIWDHTLHVWERALTKGS
ncbi:hypothetical protein F4778DRAFT_800897 [Xylariomycetidae sp. FL2044]|nr:hypothetical protein F4778DRAFT_800897 [Xylariomycetidae sp. FL2044]